MEPDTDLTDGLAPAGSAPEDAAAVPTLPEAATPAGGGDDLAFGLDAESAVETVAGMVDYWLALFPRLFVGLLVFLLFWVVARLVRRSSTLVGPLRHSRELAMVIGRLTHSGLLLLGGLIAVTVVFPSMTPGRLISVLGIGGAAIGFALKDIFQNFVAGILILLRHPFRLGDEIVSGDIIGTVESIEARATFIRTYDGQRIVVPNSRIYIQPVTIITAYDLLRTEIDVGIGTTDDIDRAKRIALEVVRGIDGVLDTPRPDVLTWELAPSTTNLRVRYWTRPQRDTVLSVRDEALHRLRDSLVDGGIELPFPTHVVMLPSSGLAWPAGRTGPARRA